MIASAATALFAVSWNLPHAEFYPFKFIALICGITPHDKFLYFIAVQKPSTTKFCCSMGF